MSADRLKTDSIKSPVMPDKEHKNPNKTLLYKGPVRISDQFFCAITHVRIETKQPPEKPAALLFGLAAIRPLLFFPNRTPKNQAAESFIKTVNKKRLNKNLDSLKRVMR